MSVAPAADAPQISSALETGGETEREAAFVAIEGVVRGAQIPTSAMRAEVTALVAASVKPLVVSVLSAPASRVAEAETLRAALLLYEMCTLDAVAVCGEMWRKDEQGTVLLRHVFDARDSAHAAVLAKDSSKWTRENMLLVAAVAAPYALVWAAGGSAVLGPVGVGEMEGVLALLTSCVYFHQEPPGRFTQPALLCLDLIRSSEKDSQPKGILVGAWQFLQMVTQTSQPVSVALWEAGFVKVFQATISEYSPMERISRKAGGIPGAAMAAMKEVTQKALAAGIEVIQPLVNAGVIDIAIAQLTAYQMLGKPEEASVQAIQYGALYPLEVMLGSPHAAPIVVKLRSAGVDCVRYLLDHCLTMLGDLGLDSQMGATKVAALVWGKDEDGGGFTFTQQDVDKVVWVADHRGAAAAFYTMSAEHGQAILSLVVSDLNKALLLNATGFIPLLVDSLLLDPAHPRMDNETVVGVTDWDAAKGPVQRDFAEAIAQLAMYPPGREALLRDPTVAEALRQVAATGWTEEARVSAEAALLAMSEEPEHERKRDDDGTGEGDEQQQQSHIMVSYQWDCQPVVRRIVNELQTRQYRTWFDLDNMKGSTVDAMSEAVEEAALMLSCISLKYKESANCRLEAQYGHQQRVDLIPLLMEKGYQATGWLGIILGMRLWYPFHPEAITTDAAFLQQMDAVVREIGERGKANAKANAAPARPARRDDVTEGVPPVPAPAPPLPPAAAAAAAAAAARAPELPLSGAFETPARTLAPAHATASASTPEQSRFTPSMQLSSTTQQHRGVEDASLVSVLLEREDQLRQEAKHESQQLRQEMEAKLQKLQLEMTPAPPVEAISKQQIDALQARLEAMHGAELLKLEELEALEDTMADFFEARPSWGGASSVLTIEMANANEPARKLLQLISVSEGIATDRAFARQCRRKYI